MQAKDTTGLIEEERDMENLKGREPHAHKISDQAETNSEFWLLIMNL